ncbi:MAG: hypothetical protein US25_C0037G0005 [Candidatus Moranbacteria bacterium GW2011_GWE1_36_7]|nr:MAG: hypothetical protein UR99_C0002G0035 [Candidatus Moranbacteria bacterium GW2011_GWD2_36_12]KKQ07060.1 MAG: hypothetical protein US16_C0003G0035 [Candidatus Moranbacteria bacterium GW2011_GWE2_36_40]KKQ13610.1 MAG: hypothetical protein US25_C0037G0005 [Candidatus Moranbacteria bacterium GW2011_GWE1_36_7]
MIFFISGEMEGEKQIHGSPPSILSTLRLTMTTSTSTTPTTLRMRTTTTRLACSSSGCVYCKKGAQCELL